MEFENIFRGVALMLVGIIAYFALFVYWNDEYGTNVGYSANSTYSHAQSLAQTNLFDMSINVGNNTNTPSGAGSTSANTDLVSRALSIITTVPILLGLVPALYSDFGSIMGIPSIYVQIGAWVFLFSFAILFAYLLIIGVRRLL
jgi:hypothetical protein